MIVIIVTDCASCPFVIADQPPWHCNARGFDVEANPRELPKLGGFDAPPDWCPLREADRVVTLRTKP